MVNTQLLQALDSLSPAEQRAILAVAEYLIGKRSQNTGEVASAEAITEEFSTGAIRFNLPDEGLSPARIAARRFMRENPELMNLLAR
jgi:hypothetical protein